MGSIVFGACYMDLLCKIDSYKERKSATLIMRGSSTDDSRKSLSPVRNRSTFEESAARKIGLSYTSRIKLSASKTSSGIGITRMIDNEE